MLARLWLIMGRRDVTLTDLTAVRVTCVSSFPHAPPRSLLSLPRINPFPFIYLSQVLQGQPPPHCSCATAYSQDAPGREM